MNTTTLINRKTKRFNISRFVGICFEKPPGVLMFCLVSLIAGALTAHATYLSTTSIEAAGQDWTTAIWQTNSTPGDASGQTGAAVGANATTGPGNTFEMLGNGGAMQSGQASVTVTAIRTPVTAATFPGASLILDTNTVIKFKTAGPTTFTNFVLKGGVLSASGVNQRVTISGGIQVLSQSYLSCASDADAVGPGVNSGAAYTINAAISGSGNLFLMCSPNNTTNIISGGAQNTFNGQWIIQNGVLRGDNVGSLGTNSIIVDPSNTLYLADMPLITPAVGGAGSAVFDVSYDLDSAGALILTNGGKMSLHQSCAFTKVIIQGTPLSAGTHSYAELTNSFPTSFFAGGSGSITIQPYTAAWPPFPPGFTTQPQSVVTTAGKSVFFSVVASNSPSGYQWYGTNNNVVTVVTNGGDITGATTPTLQFTNVAFADAGNYFVVATSVSGAATSSVVALSVYSPSDLIITNIYPDGTSMYQASNTFQFTAVSASAGIATTGVQVMLNGLNVSNKLTIGGTSLSRTVSCPLSPNQNYTAIVSVTDSNGLQVMLTNTFSTFSPTLSIEAADYDFNGGQFTNGIDAYQGLLGIQSIDMNVLTPYGPGTDYLYRPTNDTPQIACAAISDIPRPGWGTNAVYEVGYYHVGEWMNYTRAIPAGTYNVYARMGSANSGVIVSLGAVTNGVGTSTQSVSPLGTFSYNGRGWSTYDFVPLMQSGSMAALNLSGTNTFRLTATSSEANVCFFIFVPVASYLPVITNLYPDGAVLMQATNKLAFTAQSSTYGFSPNNITVKLNGADVSSQLSFSGASNALNVSLPLALNTNYSATIQVMDSNGNIVSKSFYFDTFSPTNFTFEAEDFDFNGGQYIDNPGIDAYSNQVSTPYIDEWFVNQVSGAPYAYRPSDWISTAVTTDLPRQSYITAGLPDYHVGYWLGGSWINYTHNYPAGTYTVWARLAGGTTYNIQLTNTINGNSSYLGTFTATGRGWSSFDWVPLKNATGQMVPVTLGGVSTLTMLTDGNANANFYMLVSTNAVSVPPNAVSMTSSVSADKTSMILSFPTQVGYNYQIFYKTNLTDPTWLPLSTLPGNGGSESFTNSTADGSRFFRLLIQ